MIQVVVFAFFCVFSFSSFAGVFILPRTMEEIHQFAGDTVEVENYFVPGSVVSWANYHRLKTDFPFLKGMSNAKIDQWIVKNFAYISKYQLDMGSAYNEPIPVDKDNIQISYRTPEQGRGDTAIVYDLEGKPFGLMDRKGVGVGKKLSQRIKRIQDYYEQVGDKDGVLRDANMTNGLLDHAEGVKESAIMVLAQKIFDLKNASEHRLNHPILNPRQTIEGYFIIRYPFKAQWLDDPEGYASIYGRQAHVGRYWHGPVYEDKIGVSLRQTDMFMAWVDGDSAKVKDLEMRTSMLAQGILYPDTFRFKMELAEEHTVAWDNGDKNAIKNYFDKVSRFVDPQWSQLNLAKLEAPNMTPEQVLDWTADLMLEDVKARARMALIFIKAQELGMDGVLAGPKVQKIIQQLLEIPLSEQEVISGTDEPIRRLGVLLIPSLKNKKARNKAVKQEMTQYLGSTLRYLAQTAWMLEEEMVRTSMIKMLRREGKFFVQGLVNVLGKEQAYLDSRFSKMIKMYRLALSFVPDAADEGLNKLSSEVQNLVKQPAGAPIPSLCEMGLGKELDFKID